MFSPNASGLFLSWLVCFAFVAQSPIVSARQVLADEKNKPADVTIRGRITSAEGPISNAIAYVFREERVAETVSGEDGLFQINLDSDEPAKTLIMAAGKISQIHLLNPKTESRIEIQLEDQQSLLTGRIIDNEGMDVTDAKLRIVSLQHKNESIDIPAGLKDECFEASTDGRGKFQFAGIEKSMVGTIRVTGQRIVASFITRDSFDDEIVLVVQPAKAVVGKVIDQLLRQPISNVVISSANGQARATVDDSGKFELPGLPAFQPLILTANSMGNEPYLLATKRIPLEQGFDPIEIEIGLERGVWIKCNIKDFGSGGPATADVYYFPTPANKNFQSFVESFLGRGAFPSTSTNSAGAAKVVAIPGPGVIAVFAAGFPPNESVKKLTDEQRAMLTQVTGRNDVTAVEWIAPKDLHDQIELSFLVSKGRAIEIELAANQLDPTDRLVVHRAAAKTSFNQSVLGPKFVVEQFQPGETRQVLIHAPQKTLGAIVNVAAEANSPVQVALQPTGSIVGRVVNKNSDPQPGLLMQFEVPTDDGYQEIATQVFSDANGRFEKPSLIAGLEYRVTAERPTQNQPMMMKDSPMIDSRWYVAERLIVNSGEAVDLGSMVLGAASQPEPTRQPISQNRLRKEVVETGDSLPATISGVVTNEAGEPIVNAMISFNTWPNRTGEMKHDMKFTASILSQSRSDSNGNFQMTIDEKLQEKLVTSDAYEGKQTGKPNAAIVIVAAGQGAIQIPLQEISEPQRLKIQMVREMIVRGNVSSVGDSEIQTVKLMTGSSMRVYDVDSINQMIAGLEEGTSLKTIIQKFQPVSTLDPLVGGIPMIWETSSSGVFLVRNIPINTIFELHAIGAAGQRKTITVISRPIRGFDFRPTDDSPDTMPLQGSRVRLEIGQQGK